MARNASKTDVNFQLYELKYVFFSFEVTSVSASVWPLHLTNTTG